MKKLTLFPVVIRSYTNILLFLFLTLHLTSEAQNFSWAKQFNYGSTNFYNKISGMDAAGNYYSSGANFVVKLTQTGTVAWVRQFNGLTGGIRGLAVDPSGNVVVAGTFSGTYNFNRAGGTFNLSTFGYDDIFVERMDANGAFVWAVQMGGPGMDRSSAVCFDTGGQIYLTGNFGYFGPSNPPSSADFDPGPAQYTLSSTGGYDYFVEKLDGNGNFLWAKSAGGPQNDGGSSIATDPFGNLFVWGGFAGTVTFDPTTTLTGSNGRFLEKFDLNGNFQWVKALQTNGCCIDITDVAIDASGNLLTTGYFSGTVDFDPGSATYNLNGPNLQDLFIWKLDNSGNFAWAKKVDGGTSNPSSKSCHGDGIAVDSYGNVYTTGDFTGGGNFDFDPGPGTYNLKTNSASMCVLKLNSSGNFVWAIAVGGNKSSSAVGYGIQIGTGGEVYTSVNFSGTVNFNPNGTYNLSSSNGPFAIQKLTQPSGGAKVAEYVDAKTPLLKTISAFPNPSGGSFFVDIPAMGGNATLRIYDISGKIIRSQPINATSRQRIFIDVDRNGNGTYVIEARNKAFAFQTKIVVQ